MYVVGGIIWLILNMIGYGINKDFGDDTQPWSKRVFLTPVWPVVAIGMLSLKLKEMWDDSGLGDDLSKFKNNLQKEAK